MPDDVNDDGPLEVKDLLAQKPSGTAHTVSQVRNAVGWLGMIAIFTLVNVLLWMYGTPFRMIIGLQSTRVAIRLFGQMGLLGVELEFVLALALAGIFAIAAWFALKQAKSWPLAVAGALYLVDMVAYAAAPDVISIAFHGLALYYIYTGYVALRTLERQQLEVVQMTPQVDSVG